MLLRKYCTRNYLKFTYFSFQNSISPQVESWNLDSKLYHYHVELNPRMLILWIFLSLWIMILYISHQILYLFYALPRYLFWPCIKFPYIFTTTAWTSHLWSSKGIYFTSALPQWQHSFYFLSFQFGFCILAFKLVFKNKQNEYMSVK